MIDEKCLNKKALIDELVMVTRCTLLSNLVAVILLLILSVAVCFRKL